MKVRLERLGQRQQSQQPGALQMAGDLRHRLHPVDVYKVRTRVTGDGSTFEGGACCRTVEAVEGGVNVVVMLFPLVCRTFILDTSWDSET